MASASSSRLSPGHGPLSSPKMLGQSSSGALRAGSGTGQQPGSKPSHYYTRHFDNETFLCCPVPNTGSPVSAVFLADRLQRLNFLSRTNYILSLLCLLVIGSNVVTLVLNVLNVQRAPLGPDDPVPGPDDPPPSVMDQSGLEKAFHCVEFWTAFSFSLIEVLVIVHSPRSVSDIYSKSPWMFKLIIVAQVVSTFVSAMLVTLDLEIFEVLAHEVEYANEILLSFLNVVLAGRLTGARTAFTRGRNAYGVDLDSESRTIDLAIDREDLSAQLLPNRQQGRSNLPPYPEIYCPPMRPEGATGAVFSSSSSATPADAKKDAQENADLALVNPEGADVAEGQERGGAPGSTGGTVLAGEATGGSSWSSSNSGRNLRRKMLSCLANVPVVLSPLMAVSLMVLYNDILEASEPMQGVNILLTGEVQAHFLEFVFNIGSAAVAFAFCMDNKMLCDLQMSELIGEWSQGVIN